MLNFVERLDFSSLVYVMYYTDFQLLSQPSTHGINVTLPVLSFDEKFNLPIFPSMEKFMDSVVGVKSNNSLPSPPSHKFSFFF